MRRTNGDCGVELNADKHGLMCIMSFDMDVSKIVCVGIEVPSLWNQGRPIRLNTGSLLLIMNLTWRKEQPFPHKLVRVWLQSLDEPKYAKSVFVAQLRRPVWKNLRVAHVFS